MKEYLTRHKFNFSLLAVTAAIGIVANYIFISSCFKETCGVKISAGILSPLLVFSIGIFALHFLFLFLPSTYFKKWLLYITTWYLPLTFYIASNTKPLGGSILSPSRSEAVIYMMMILGVITIIFLGVQWLISRRQRKI